MKWGEGENMRRRFKIAFAILLVVTIVWALACYLHVQAYNQMIERYRQILGEALYLVTFKPIWAVWNGPLLFIIGFFMIITWMGFLTELYRLRKGVWENARFRTSLSLVNGVSDFGMVNSSSFGCLGCCVCYHQVVRKKKKEVKAWSVRSVMARWK